MNIEDVKKRVSLIEVAKSIGVSWLDNKGGQRCPICQSSRGLKVTEDRYFRCYRCGSSGSAYDLLLLTKNSPDFKSAHRSLCRFTDARINFGAANDLEEVFKVYQDYYQQNPEPVNSYCRSRGWEDILEVGYAPENKGLLEAGLDPHHLTQLDLLHPDRGEYYKNYVVFPVKNRQGRIVHLCGRSLNPESKLRWKSTKGKPAIHNYFYNEAALYNAEGNYIVVCEGISDCLSLMQIGVPAIGQFGINVNLSLYAEQFSNFEYILFAYDCDKYPLGSPYAGKYKSWSQMMPEVIELLCRINKKAYYIALPNYSGIKDINDWLVEVLDYNAKEYQRYISNQAKSIESLAISMYEKEPHEHRRLWSLFSATQNKQAARSFYNSVAQDPVDYLLSLH